MAIALRTLEVCVQRVAGRWVLSPTDLTKHLACAHLSALDRWAALDPQSVPAGAPDEALELLFRKGLEHERAHLPRREHPSALGRRSYDVADTKLARRLTVAALLQMATYAERLGALQGSPVVDLVVVGGDGVEHPWPLVDVAAFARRARTRLPAAIEHPAATEAIPRAHCAQCRRAARCERSWVESDDLSLVACMRADHRRALRAAGGTTSAGLAAGEPAALPGEIAPGDPGAPGGPGTPTGARAAHRGAVPRAAAGGAAGPGARPPARAQPG